MTQPAPAHKKETKVLGQTPIKKGFIPTLDVKKGSGSPAKFSVKKGEPNVTQPLEEGVKFGGVEERSEKAPAAERDMPNLTSDDLPNLTLRILGGAKVDYNGQGRENGFADVIEMLTYVYNHRGQWPSAPVQTPAMRRYYRRQYPWFFAKFDAAAQTSLEEIGLDEKGAAQYRTRDQEKAAKLRRQNRPSRARVDKAERGVKKGNKTTTKFDAAGGGAATTRANRREGVKKGDVKKGDENIHRSRSAPVDIRTRRAKA